MTTMTNKFAAQLYTLHNEIKKDFPSVLRELKNMGWNAVQIDGLKGYPVEDIATVMNELGLSTAGMHVGLNRINEEPNVLLHEATVLNTRDIICLSMPDDERHVEGYVKARRELRAFAQTVTNQGYRVGYHNHDFEFHTQIEGCFAMEYMLDDPENHPIHPEFDTYWLKKANQDPLAFIRRYAGRIKILHFKDMTNDDRQTFAEVGTGSIDFEPLLIWGEQNGIEWYAVEQDVCPGNPFDSLALSLENLIKMAEKLAK